MWNNSPKLYSVEQIRQLEKLAVESFNITKAQLMQRAGAAAFQFLQMKLPNVQNILVLCGRGNNGGDGYVLAHLARLSGLNVNIRYIGQPDDLNEICRSNYLTCVESDIECKPFDPDEIFDADVIVDALLGIGIKGEVKEPYKTAIEKINTLNSFVLSMDVPSGLDADFGVVLGSAVKADLTATFIGIKKGLKTHEGLAVSGYVHCDTLEIPQDAFDQVPSNIRLLTREQLESNLPPKRPREAHKGDFGHVLVIGGDHGMAGAVRMAAEAAARTGAGLVSIATRPEHVETITGVRPELMCHGVVKPKDLISLIKKASVIVIGPGLGTDDWGSDLFEAILEAEQPKVIDADGLNLLAQHAVKQDNWVLTPHPGEAKRLINQEIQCDRFAAAANVQSQYGGVCVLKGAGTLICLEAETFVCDAGNPGMASGGMGDVLSGVIGALIGQKYSMVDAAALGVLLHAVSADLVAEREGERGMLALDIICEIHKLINGLK